MSDIFPLLSADRSFSSEMIKDMVCTLVSNLEECRLEAELSDSDGTVVAIVFQDSAGWHVETLDSDRKSISSEFLEKLKASMQQYVNRTGSKAPEGLTRGELALWLMVKDDGTAMGRPYMHETQTLLPIRYEPTVLPDSDPGLLRGLLAYFKRSR